MTSLIKTKKQKNHTNIKKTNKKQVYRLYKKTEKYDKLFCDKKLDDILKEFKSKIVNTSQYTYFIHPYCTEKVRGLKSINKVNQPYVLLKRINELTTYFNYNYNVDENISKTSKSLISPYVSISKNVDLFLEYIKKESFNEANHFIVTHSNFLRKLYKKLNDNKNILFDNLDILHIQIDKDKKIIIKGIYKWNDEYKTNNKNKRNKGNIFLMRHCTACHNHPKSTKYKKLTKKNYGSNSVCFPEIINQFIDKTTKQANEHLKGLYELLNKYGEFETFQFGSSVIYRAILTSIIIYNLLNNYKKQLTINKEQKTKK